MIQRIQSVWLLLAAATATLSFKFEFYSGINSIHPTLYKINATESMFTLLLTVAVSGLAFFTIFLFKNRKLQFRLSILGILLEALLIFVYYTVIRNYTYGSISIWALLHGAILFFFFLTARAIKKDEKLIQESDRLR
ncbi:MAG: DUF4293 family protein [Chitinophagaceae bacterium]